MEGIVAHVQVLAAVPLNSDAITMVCVNVPLYQFVSFWESWFVRYDRTVRNNIPSARARCTTRSSGNASECMFYVPVHEPKGNYRVQLRYFESRNGHFQIRGENCLHVHRTRTPLRITLSDTALYSSRPYIWAKQLWCLPLHKYPHPKDHERKQFYPMGVHFAPLMFADHPRWRVAVVSICIVCNKW